MDERVKAALEVIACWAGVDGAHHKDFAIDQAVRALCGCPRRTTEGQPPIYETCPEYEAWVVDWEEAGTYCWEEGIAP